MAITLRKGGQQSLEETKIKIALGWKERNVQTNSSGFDLDLSAFLLNDQGRVLSDGHFIYYNQLTSPCKNVEHYGDDKSGNDLDDSEIIRIDLRSLDSTISTIAICVTIHQAKLYKQNFGMVSDAYLKIIDEKTNEEKVYCDISKDLANGSASILALISWKKNGWSFSAIQEVYDGDLKYLAQNKYGVSF